nr:DNA polymerase [Ganoderma sichuanense]QUA00733.1 DNA polymerase [Ganoderma sichuanense]
MFYILNIIRKPIPPKYVGPELGQFKLEGVFYEVIFLAPKVRGS